MRLGDGALAGGREADGSVAERDRDVAGDGALTFKTAGTEAVVFPAGSVSAFRGHRHHVPHMGVTDAALRPTVNAELQFGESAHQGVLRFFVIVVFLAAAESLQVIVHVAGAERVFAYRHKCLWERVGLLQHEEAAGAREKMVSPLQGMGGLVLIGTRNDSCAIRFALITFGCGAFLF